MDELTSIRTFINVVETGSFSAAARRASSSTSSVARQIKSLEDELGVRLINRNTRRQSLTEPGQVFFERAATLLKSLQAAKSEAKSFRDSAKGLLRVSLRVSIGISVILPALPQLLERYPDLIVEVLLTDKHQDLITNEIDLAVWMGTLPNSEIIARRLCPSERIVCGAPDYFKKNGIPRVPDDLTKHSCIVYNSYGKIWTLTKDGTPHHIAVDGRLRTDNSLAMMTAAQSGIGLIIAHEWLMRQHLAEGKLVRVLSDYSVSPTNDEAPLYVVYPNGRGLSKKVRIFVDFLIELFQDRNPAPGAAAAKGGMRVVPPSAKHRNLRVI